MNTREVIERYYAAVNTGDWDAWLALFDDAVVIDEQLAGHLEGTGSLRGACAGLRAGYSRFQNVPRHTVVQGEEGCVISHVSAANARGEPIEADVANYFRVRKGKIVYLANFHDTVPFRPFTEQGLPGAAHPGAGAGSR
jgi:ketosteroid isomerase-like protein